MMTAHNEPDYAVAMKLLLARGASLVALDAEGCTPAGATDQARMWARLYMRIYSPQLTRWLTHILTQISSLFQLHLFPISGECAGDAGARVSGGGGGGGGG